MDCRAFVIEVDFLVKRDGVRLSLRVISFLINLFFTNVHTVVVGFFYIYISVHSEAAFHLQPPSNSRGDIQKITLFKCIVNIH